MRWLASVVLAFTFFGCSPDQPESLGAAEYGFDPVCDLGGIEVDGVTYEVVGVDEFASHEPAPDPTHGSHLMGGSLERFDNGTATWTGNGYEVRFDSHSDEGMYQVC